MKLISGIMMPVLPALIACGIVNALVSILSSAGALAPEYGMYVLLHAIGNSCVYFFPVIIGGSAARFFGMDAYIGAVIGASLIHPSLAALSTSGGSIDSRPVHPGGKLCQHGLSRHRRRLVRIGDIQSVQEDIA